MSPEQDQLLVASNTPAKLTAAFGTEQGASDGLQIPAVLDALKKSLIYDLKMVDVLLTAELDAIDGRCSGCDRDLSLPDSTCQDHCAECCPGSIGMARRHLSYAYFETIEDVQVFNED